MNPQQPTCLAGDKVRRLAIIGGGWAGLAAAVRATELDWQVQVYEAARQWGGRARTLGARPAGTALSHGSQDEPSGLDNGQHILIGAYRETLELMRQLGVDLGATLQAIPLDLRYADGSGLAVPGWAARWPQPLDLLATSLGATGWSWHDRIALLRRSLRWRATGFTCPEDLSVTGLCTGLPPRVVAELIEPLCLSALNTPMAQASAAVLLRVLRDALFGAGFGRWRGADLLLPRVDLGELLPEPALRWLTSHGAGLHAGRRVARLERTQNGWQIGGESFDAVLLACPPREAARLVRTASEPYQAQQDQDDTARAQAMQLANWADCADALRYEAIATVYAQALTVEGKPAGLPQDSAMVALRSGPDAPAQFAFDRGQLGGPAGLLAFVISASQGERADIEQQVLQQARAQLGLQQLQALKTVVEKRATFACTPGLQRPASAIAPGLWAAGDYIAGPYPATLEGAVRSGQQAVAGLQAEALN
ncbi:hydroxysqualene dehydroxylase HpnE [Malikia sp.]|uniref:hydroxysqualene dehydroxylase HpnE n=1 Tax=Malikia sp. TaxID=2070706 RepID=UPI0026170F9E|nr:hydroxysqualene dehydroxylase HpnE [Malikia sp.]MDD2729276.1 hydroxysqualene dehydroxylase HpnE [Malikia sp.]